MKVGMVDEYITRKALHCSGRSISAANSGLFDRQPERHLNREKVAARRAERTEQICQPDAVSNGLGRSAVLLPYKVENAAGTPLPAKHDIATERADIEVGIFQ